MGTHLLLHPSFLTTTPPQPSLFLLNPLKFVTITYPIISGGQTLGLSNWVSTKTTGRVRINLQDELYTDGDDGFDEFGFTGTAKQRMWWSNDDDESWVDDDEENEFWVFKVVRAFGWMLPAIGISLLLGTGPNAFFMALAVPLGQTALSLVIDKVWGCTSSEPRPRPRTRNKKKPFVSPGSGEKTTKKKEEKRSDEEKGSYQSWVAADGGSYKKRGGRVNGFRGWDELDDVREVPRGIRREDADELPMQQTKGKLSRTRRVRDTPLFLRLLIAMFPFLGSWTRFLF